MCAGQSQSNDSATPTNNLLTVAQLEGLLHIGRQPDLHMVASDTCTDANMFSVIVD